MNMIKFAEFVSWLTSAIIAGRSSSFNEIDIVLMHNMIVNMTDEVKVQDTPKIDLMPLFTCIINNKKIDAIKEHRTITGMGLKESKDEIERVMNASYDANNQLQRSHEKLQNITNELANANARNLEMYNQILEMDKDITNSDKELNRRTERMLEMETTIQQLRDENQKLVIKLDIAKNKIDALANGIDGAI